MGILTNIVTENKRKALKYEREFRRVFGVPLNPYIDLLTGFDVVKFDEQFIKSGDGCMADSIRTKYGDTGVLLIGNLIEHFDGNRRALGLELALALLLWRDFKTQEKYDADIILQMLRLAEKLEVSVELQFLMANLPPMEIKPRK